MLRSTIHSLILVFTIVAFVHPAAAQSQMLYQEPLRPQFHFTARKNWINDPNGLVWYNGVYHLFFQYNPYGTDSANKAWGHATSKDLMHWTEHDVALLPDEFGDIWSGSAVVDENNTSGFQKGTDKPIVLIYTAAGGTNKESKGREFTQCLAYSSDGGNTWQKYEKNPVLQHVRGHNRDPKVIWHAPSKQWVMVLYLDKNDFGFFGSPDLKTWTRIQQITVPGMEECPDCWQMPIENEPGQIAWVWTAANAKYLVGEFDGKQFVPENGFNPIRSEFGKNFYAAQTFSNTPDGRRIQIGWMVDGKYPGMPFNQQLSVPTVLTLHRAPDGLRLRRLPIEEIKALRDVAATRTDIPLSDTGEKIDELRGDLLDVNAVIEIGSAKRAGLRVRGQTITFDAAANTVNCLSATAPLKPIDGRIKLRVLVDHTSIEVFANDGVVSLACCYLPDQNADARPPAFFAEGGTAKLVSFEGFTLKSSWKGKRPAIVANRAPLVQTPFIRLPLGSVQPEGWLLKQLQLQKSGLTGSAEQMYDALVPTSAWLGGKGENWERGPYYVKGLIALAHTLDDDELKQRAQKWIDWALQSQRADGSFGPTFNDDWWPRMVVLFYLRDHYEATGDPRVILFLQKYFKYQLAELPKRHLRDWGKARAGDNIDVVLWTYNLTSDASLLDLAKLLRDQAYPWPSIFANNEFYGRFPEFHPHHIVNVNQAMKEPPVIWQFTQQDSDRNALAQGLAHLNRQFGRIDGQISGTEMLSSRSSTGGVELCADIERIISNGIAITILGDAALGDDMEKVAYNSLPGHTSAHLQQITYYQLPNQVACTFGGHGFTQDYNNGNVPGPHSGFPCCCYNWHSGWPKFVQSMWAATSDGGLALLAYGPNRVNSTVAGGVPITVTQATEYPFNETVTLKVEPEKAATFPLVLRVPGWCDKPEIRVNGAAVDGVKPATFHHIQREWKPGDIVEIKFPMTVRASTWINNSVGLERGPLAFGLQIKEQWRKAHEFLHNFNEFEVLAQSPWNYALQIDRDAPKVSVQTRAVSDVPFDTDAVPVVLSVSAKRLPSWGTKTLHGRVVLGRADGQWRELGNASTPAEPDLPHHLRVEMKGQNVRIFVDNMDRPLIEQPDDSFVSGSIGLRAYDTVAKFDDIKLNGELVADFNQPQADQSWQTFSGHWTVHDGAFAVERARDAKVLLKNRADVGDLVVDATVTIAPGGDAGFIFRAKDLTERLDGYHGYYVGLSTRHGKSDDADEPPPSPVRSDEPTETVQLIPFGSAKLRVCYFPVLQP